MAASYLDKAQVNTAVTDNTKLDLGHQHVTTADFMQLNVATCMELVPGSSIDVKMESFARLNPLVVPTFGRASMRNRAFFVPFRTIFRGWNDFITDSVHIASDGYYSANLLSNCPTVSTSTLLSAFTSGVGSHPNDNTVFLYTDGSWQPSYAPDLIVGSTMYNFTNIGRQAYKNLEALGYKLDTSNKNSMTLSAMPLLALAKIVVDWYWPQQYTNIGGYDSLLALCNKDVNSGPLSLTASNVFDILLYSCFVQYDSDYFVSAWDNPSSPNTGNYSNFKLVNIDTIKTSIGTHTSSVGFTYDEDGYVSNNSGAASVSDRVGYANAPFITPVVASHNTTNNTPLYTGTPISEYLLHSLHALTDYMKRHQLAGSKAFDRYLARFGKALPAEKLNRSLYLGASMQDIQIGDVMSTSDTFNSSTQIGSQLGSYAGKGMSYGNGHFSCDTDEFGYFIILSSIVPATGYFQGIDRTVMRISKLDFFTPEFDSLGAQPITAAELYIPQYGAQMTTGDPYQQIFGFTPRYADYKQSTVKNRVTGNFRLRSINAYNGLQKFNASDSWYLDRVFDGPSDFNYDYTRVIHSPNFISGGRDFSQYKRLFYYTGDPNTGETAPDNFTVIHNFEIAENAPMKPLWDSYEFEDKGKKVTLETNGVKLN